MTPWDVQQRAIEDELRHQATWNWSHLTADQLVTLTRLALTPSEERVRAAMWQLLASGELVMDDELRFTAPVDDKARQSADEVPWALRPENRREAHESPMSFLGHAAD